MKLTKHQLKQLIEEEVKAALLEGAFTSSGKGLPSERELTRKRAQGAATRVGRSSPEVDVTQIENPVIAGIDPNDHPDYVDAYLESGTYENAPLAPEQIEYVNANHPDYISAKAAMELAGA
jgi:hypothetical protein